MRLNTARILPHPFGRVSAGQVERRRAWGKHGSLLGGFGLLGLLLVLSSVDAYRTQSAIAIREAESYRQYVNRQEALSRLERSLPGAAQYGAGDAVPESRREAMRTVHEAALAELAPSGVPAGEVADLAAALAIVREAAEPSAEGPGAEGAERRRSDLNRRLRQMGQSSLRILAASQETIARDRQEAAWRLPVVTGIFLALTLLGAWYSVRRIDAADRRAEVRLDEAARARRELQEWSARLLDSQEEIRKRLSHDLHAGVAQVLAEAQADLAGARSNATGEARVRDARAHVSEALAAVTELRAALRPALLDEGALMPALQALLDDFSRRTGIAAPLAHESVPDRLPDAVRTCLYRVLEEALGNCERHAGASTVRVSVRHADGMLALRVSDNGRGFDAARQAGARHVSGVGLVAMRERAARLGGGFAIETAPGRGTEITVQLPVPVVQPAGEVLVHRGAGV